MSQSLISFSADDLLAPSAPAGGGKVAEFVQQYLPLAKRVAGQLGVEPQVLLGQWGLETGWGKSVIPGTNNLGNIKDPSGRGPMATDNQNGKRDAYRAFATPDDFGNEFVGLMGRMYKPAIGAGGDAQKFFTELKRVGYAEDKDYIRKGVAAASMAAQHIGAQPAQPTAQAAAQPTRGDDYIDIKPVAAAQPRSWGEAAKDTALGLGSGLVGLFKAGGDLYGLATGDMDNAISTAGGEAQKYLEGLQSTTLQGKREARSGAIDAEDSVLGKAWAAFATTLSDPALIGDLAASNIATLIPAAAAGRATAAVVGARAMMNAMSAGPVPLAARQAIASSASKFGVAAAVGVNGVQQGADVVGDLYDRAMQKTPEQWAANPEFARRTQSGENEGQVKHELALTAAREALPAAFAISVIANAVPGGTAIERALVGGAAKSVIAKGGLPARALHAAKAALGETAGEGLEEGGGQFAGNVSLARHVDPAQDLSEGVGENAGMGAAGGFALGGASGALHAPRAALPPAADPLSDVKAKAAEPNSPLSKAAVSGNEAQQAAAPAQPEPQVDPITQKAQAIQQQVRDGGLIDALRGEDSPVDVKAFLNDLATASSPSTQQHQREQAMTRLEFAMGWAGQHAQDPGAAPSVAQRRTAVDREAQLQEQLAAATTEAEREQIRAQMGVNREMRLRAPAAETAANVAESAPISAQEQQGLESAALAGQVAQRKAEDDPRQAVITRALKSIEERNGVASPAEAQILSEAGLGQPYDRVDMTLAPALTEDQKLTQATGIALDKAPRSTQGQPSTEAADRAREQNERSDSRLQQLARERAAAAKARDAANAQPAEPAEPPAADAAISALKTIPVLRSAEQRALVAKARSSYTPDQMRILNDAANIPANLSATDKLALEQMRQSARRDEVATEDAVATEGAPTIPGGAGAAVNRKRRAQLDQLVGMGFDTVRQRDGVGFILSDSKTGNELALDGRADAQLARAAIAAHIDAQAHEAAASPKNDRAEPTPAQAEAGNYKKGHIANLNGVRVSIENPRGSVRRGVSPDGKAWETKLAHHYGDVTGTKGADGDAVDVFVGPRPDSDKIFVVDQRNADGSFDEHKVMFGFTSEAAAREGYLANYEPGWTGLGAITEMTPEAFRAWVKSPAAKKPASPEFGKDRDGQGRADQGRGAASATGAAAGRGGAPGAGDRGAAERVPGDAVGGPAAGTEVPVGGGRSARIVEPAGEAADALRAVAAAFGQRAVFFAPDRKIGDGFVHKRHPGVLFVSTGSQINPLSVLGHEFWHQIETNEPQIADAVKRVVAENMRGSKDPKDRVGFTFNDYTRGEYAEGQQVSELSADLFGNLLKDEKFWSDVMAELQKLEGGQGLVAKLVAWLNTLTANVKRALQSLGAMEGYNSERFIEDMDEVRAAYTQALAQYLKNNGIRQAAMQAEILRATQEVRKSANRAYTAGRDELDGQGLGRDSGGVAAAAGGADAPAASYGRPQEGSVSATGVHYGTGARNTLSAAFYGTGLKGAERQRLEGAENADIRPRIFFYVDKGNGIRPEAGVGGYAHRVQLNNLYDVWSDPLGLRKANPGANNWERALMKAGFDGYLSLDPKMPQGFAVLVGKKHSDVPVDSDAAPAAEPAELRKALMSREMRDIDLANIPGATLRAGTLVVPAEAQGQANAELERIGSSVRFSGDRNLERVDPMEVSTRAPSAKPKKGFTPEDSIENLLIADFSAGLGQESWMSAVADLVTQYPGYREAKSATTPERQLERQVRFMTDNLVWLHDQVPEEIRARSKLWYDGARKIAEAMSRKYGIEPSQAAGILAALSPQKDWFMNVSLADRVAQIMAERQTFRWSRQMAETADRIFGKPVYKVAIDAIKGKSLGELELDYERAMWLRVYDEAHNPRSFMIVSPEGDLVAEARTIKGELAKPAWGGNVTIAKAVSIFRDGSFANINEQLGRKHKVRNFYNNILVPNSPNGHVTIDTHAVAAALLRALSGNSVEVMHNFSGPKSAHAGLEGSYALYEEAYRRAAAELGLLPRELQSITWEAVRGLFVPGFKAQQKNVDAVDAIWYKYRKGRLSYEDARDQALQLGGGIDAPSWPGRDPGVYAEEGDASEPGDVPGDELPGRSPDDDGGAVGGGSRASATRSRGAGDRAAAGRALASPERADAEALTPLPGAPRVPGFHGPDPRLVAVAEEYARDNGIDLKRQDAYAEIDEGRASRIAAAYGAMEHAPQDPRVKAAYADLIRQTRAQYDALAAAGYRFWFIDLKRPDNAEYTTSPWNAMRDIRANRKMGVFPTNDGFGSNAAFDPESNPLLEDTGLSWPVGGLDGELAPVLANDLFRAVHDAFGHGLEGSGFRAQGEENAWQAHVRLFTGDAVGAITSETRGQNSWLNYGPHGEANRNARTEDTVFADQKTGLMPEWTWTEGRVGDAAPADSARPESQKSVVEPQTVAPYNPADDTALQALLQDEQAAQDRVVELRKRLSVLNSLKKCMG